MNALEKISRTEERWAILMNFGENNWRLLENIDFLGGDNTRLVKTFATRNNARRAKKNFRYKTKVVKVQITTEVL